MYHPTAYDPPYTHLPAGGGQPNHRKHIQDFPGVLDVVAVVSNPCRYRARYDLYRAFERHMHESGVRLTTVELAFGGRNFEVTSADNPRHVQLRTNYELWHKENLINIGASHLPSCWKYVAWIDADIAFVRHDWVQETLHQLQHYPVLQLFSHAIEVGPNYEPLKPYRGPETLIASWCYCYQNGLPYKPTLVPGEGYGHHSKVPATYWHPGFAWAMRREAWDALGGLTDHAVIGGADYHMAAGLIGKMENTLRKGLTDGYREPFIEWQERAERNIRRNIGYVDGTIVHHWHGRKSSRKYTSRWDTLVNQAFDPRIDLKRDWQNLFQLVDRGDYRSILLRDNIRKYFRARNEDETSTV